MTTDDEKYVYRLEDEVARLRAGLAEIGAGCESFHGSDCIKAGRRRNAKFGDEKWCTGCVVRTVLAVEW